MNTIITVSTIMSMYMNLVTDGTNTNYCYNAEIDNGRVMAMTVYNNHGESLEAKVKHEYLYDSEDRLVRKETLKWNSLTASWAIPAMSMQRQASIVTTLFCLTMCWL